MNYRYKGYNFILLPCLLGLFVPLLLTCKHVTNHLEQMTCCKKVCFLVCVYIYIYMHFSFLLLCCVAEDIFHMWTHSQRMFCPVLYLPVTLYTYHICVLFHFMSQPLSVLCHGLHVVQLAMCCKAHKLWNWSSSSLIPYSCTVYVNYYVFMAFNIFQQLLLNEIV